MIYTLGDIVQSVETRSHPGGIRLMASWLAGPTSQGLTPFIYFAISVPVVLYLCFLIPPMQVRDEGRHFLRACQIAEGGILSEIEAGSGNAGGVLPLAEFEFVHDKMSIEFLRNEDRTPTVRGRLDALDRESQRQAPLGERRFAAFPGATIYPPPLYLPQVAAIRIAQLFSNKVYVWFYAARVLNGLIAVLLVFAALTIARTHQLLLLIPAVLPMSLYQISSISSDALIIGLSIFFVALCIRFLYDGSFSVRTGLVFCLCLLTLGKPVHLVAGLLLLAAYRRLGWRRAAVFCVGVMAFAASAYIWWAYLARRFFPLGGAGETSGRHDPAAQMNFAAAHPILMAKVMLRTLWHQKKDIITDLIGNFEWGALPLPPWFYMVVVAIGLGVLFCILVNLDRAGLAQFALASLAAGGLAAAILLAGFVIWTPVGRYEVVLMQGRYLLPGLALFVFGSPALKNFRGLSGSLLPALMLALLLLSYFWTVRIVKHYYFSIPDLRGRNVRELYSEATSQSCPASLTSDVKDWFSVVESGRTAAYNQNYRVILSEDDGTILGESDPVLIGGNGSKWRLHAWNVYVDRFARGHLWFAAGNSACHFADIEFRPFAVPPV